MNKKIEQMQTTLPNKKDEIQISTPLGAGENKLAEIREQEKIKEKLESGKLLSSMEAGILRKQEESVIIEKAENDIAHLQKEGGQQMENVKNTEGNTKMDIKESEQAVNNSNQKAGEAFQALDGAVKKNSKEDSLIKAESSVGSEGRKISEKELKKSERMLEELKLEKKIKEKQKNGELLSQEEIVKLRELEVIRNKAAKETLLQEEEIIELTDEVKEETAEDEVNRVKKSADVRQKQLEKDWNKEEQEEAAEESKGEAVKLEEKKVEKTVGEKIETQEKTKKEKAKISSDVLNGFEELGINEQDFNNIEGFSGLSEGQQLLVLENLNQIKLGRIQEEAAVKYKKNTAESKFLGRIWQGISKKYQIAKLEKATANKIEKGGIKVHQKTLQQLVSGMKEFGPEVRAQDGKLEIQYASGFENLTPGQQKQVNEFNQISTKYSKIPYEWSLETANKKDKKTYEEVNEKYENTKKNILRLKQGEVGKKDACLYMNDVEMKVKLNQFLNSNPEVKTQLQNIKDKKVWLRALANVVTERGIYAGAGFLTRTATMSLIGLAGAPLAAAGMGGFMARRRGKETLKDREKLARRGNEDESKEAKDYVDAEYVHESIDFLITELGKEPLDTKKREEMVRSLKFHIEDAKNKIEDGTINFGNQDFKKRDERLHNQQELIKKISEGAVTAEYNGVNKEKYEKDIEVISEFLKKQDKTISMAQKKYLRNQMIRGAIMSAGFATAGYAIRHFGEESGLWGGPKNIIKPVGLDSSEADKNTLEALSNLSDEDNKYIDQYGLQEYNTKKALENVSLNPEKTASSTGKFSDVSPDKMAVAGPTPGEFAKTGQLLEKVGIPKGNIKAIVEQLGLDGSLEEDIASLKNIVQGNEAMEKAGIPVEISKKIIQNSLVTLSDPKMTITSDPNVFVEAAQEMAENNFKVAHSLLKETGADINFDKGKLGLIYEVGKGKNFQDLDPVLRRIVLDNVDLGDSEKFTAIEAAKVENALANLRDLTLGHNVAEMEANDFEDIIKFDKKTGRLEICDYDALEKKLKILTDNADNIINDESDALAYTKETSQDNWQEMLDQKTGKSNGTIAEDFSQDKSVIAAKERVQAAAEATASVNEKMIIGIEELKSMEEFKNLPLEEQGVYVEELDKKSRGIVDQIQDAKRAENNELAENLRQKREQINTYKNQLHREYHNGFVNSFTEQGVSADNARGIFAITDNGRNQDMLQCLTENPELYNQVKSFAGQSEKIQGIIEINKGDFIGGAKKLFGVNVNDSNYEFKKGIHRIKNVKEGFDIIFNRTDEGIKIGIDGPMKRNWGTKGGIFSKIKPINELTMENLSKTKSEIIRMFEALKNKQ